jgi:hypothetical protein
MAGTGATVGGGGRSRTSARTAPTAAQPAPTRNANGVALTPAGRQARERAERAQESIEDEVLAALGPKDRATLRRLLCRALEAPSANDEDVAVRVRDDAG